MTDRAALSNAQSIDIHAHAVLAGSMGTAGRHGPEIGYTESGAPWFRVGDYRLDGVRYEGSPFMESDVRLTNMDAAGIDFQVLSPNPLTYFHHIGPSDAVGFCEQHNNALAEVVLAHPTRLAGFAALPMQDIQAACAELERAINELDLLGAYVGTDIGRPLNDPALDPFYEKVVQLNVPLMIHPAPAGIDGPAGDPNLKQFDLDLLTGFAAQESIAVATLIFGGVLHRHPEIDICLSHAGGTMTSLIGRFNRACTKRPWVPEHLQYEGAFEESLQKLWFDTHVHDPRVLNWVIDIMGTDKLLLGTNFAGWDQHAMTQDVPPELALTMADNAKRLLRVST
ncbi:MAG: amidohydrolase family protein [Luminiphilus sp.]|nr:amidohydrolase family protein [Gammaproteobacteria bacterium]